MKFLPQVGAQSKKTVSRKKNGLFAFYDKNFANQTLPTARITPS